MKVEQISVFMENKAGRLAQITRILGAAGVNILTLSLADTADFGILRLLVSDNDKAYEVLKEEGFTVGRNEVLAIEVPDRPGGLADFLEILRVNEINIEYMYAYRKGTHAILIFRFDNIDKAINVLPKANFNVLTREKLYNL
ncbi:MAG: ACT domain-containing protein [Proteobacteria bacterium]|nr:ACT domain-containing protein [Pseudomonadota bacterium]